MNTIRYKLRLYQLRSKLQDKGIKQPINEMIKEGFIEKDPKNFNYLDGRVKNLEFLDKLEQFNNIVE